MNMDKKIDNGEIKKVSGGTNVWFDYDVDKFTCECCKKDFYLYEGNCYDEKLYCKECFDKIKK